MQDLIGFAPMKSKETRGTGAAGCSHGPMKVTQQLELSSPTAVWSLHV